MIFVCVVRAEHIRWLVYGKSPALWTLLAGLIGFDSSFGCEEKTYPPPAAAIFQGVSSSRSHLNRRKATAACPTSLE
jgi:hypothetical protein